MVSALFGGKALPAGELAVLAGVSPQSASAHLQKLTDARLLSVWQQGRFRYYRIADDEVAGLIENLVNVAARTDHPERARGLPTPLRQARTCYCHLAGQLGVALRDGLVGKELIAPRGREAPSPTKGSLGVVRRRSTSSWAVIPTCGSATIGPSVFRIWQVRSPMRS